MEQGKRGLTPAVGRDYSTPPVNHWDFQGFKLMSNVFDIFAEVCVVDDSKLSTG